MPFDGFGAFIRLRNWVADATAGVKIRADFHDTEDDGFAQGLSNCICRDGQSTITQNIPFNSKRITALADPVDPQDAATKHYADTKAPLDGGVPFTGDVIIRNDDPSLTLDGKPGFKNSIFGDKNSKHRWEIVIGDATPETGSNAGSNFDLIGYADDGTTVTGTALFGTRSTGLLTVKGDPTAALGVATKQYADTKLPLAGGTITGSLTVNGNLGVGGELLAKGGYLRFTTSGGAGYIQWNGGGNYSLGGGGTIWHSGNFNPAASAPVLNGQLVYAGQHNHTTEGTSEPFYGAVVTGCGYPEAIPHGTLILQYRYLQLYTTGWFTCGYYP